MINMATKIVAQVLSAEARIMKELVVLTKGCTMIFFPPRSPVAGYGYIKSPTNIHYLFKHLRPITLQHNWIKMFPIRL